MHFTIRDNRKKNMKKFLVVAALICGMLFCANASYAASSQRDNSYKAIVKIESYVDAPQGAVNLFSTGSGVIIDPSGIVLTNNHVVAMEDGLSGGDYDAGYLICLTNEIDQKPDCSYIGKIIKKDKDLDLALLKMEKLPGRGVMGDLSYLNINKDDNTSVNDEVTALGYPGIGGDTITITKGVVSGKVNKYAKDWIKTDAVISYGSSGGAAIDKNGNIIGITSSAHSDLLGSMGYIINASSIYPWALSNKYSASAANSITDKVAAFAQKKLDIEKINIFENKTPSFSITKPADWKFDYEGESSLYLTKEGDDDGGAVTISILKQPYKVGLENVEPYIKRQMLIMGVLGRVSIIRDSDIAINGLKGKKITISYSGTQQNMYYLPLDNYFIELSYDFGKDDKDKAIVDGIVNSFKRGASGNYSPLANYSQNDPKFSLSASENWHIQINKLKTQPLTMAYEPIKEAYADVDIIKVDEETKKLSNDDFLKQKIQEFSDANAMASTLNMKMEIIKSSAHYKLNNELNGVIMMQYAIKNNDGVVLCYNIEYWIKSGNKYIAPSFNFFNANAESFNKALAEFNKVLQTLSLKNAPVAAGDSASTVKVKNKTMFKSLKGKILLKVEDGGKAYYVNPQKETIHSLGKPADAFVVMREQGVGITNADLKKIPVDLSSLSGVDSDQDGLPDMLEDALGTDKIKKDTDNDGLSDKKEVENGKNPNGTGATAINNTFCESMKGKILLQVEGHGEAWYVNPKNNKRYFLGRPADAFSVMRVLGLGISNGDFSKL